MVFILREFAFRVFEFLLLVGFVAVGLLVVILDAISSGDLKYPVREEKRVKYDSVEKKKPKERRK